MIFRLNHFSYILKCLVIAFIVYVSSFIDIYSQNITLNKGDNRIKVKTNTYSTLRLSSTLNNLKVRNISNASGNYSILEIKDYGNSFNVGSPNLPVLRKFIEVPVNAKIKTKIVNQHSQEYDMTRLGISNQIYPCQPRASKDSTKKAAEFQKNISIYQRNSFVKADTSPVTVKYLGIMRGVNLACLNISPVEYNPTSKSIKIYDNIDVEISFENADIAKTMKLKENTGYSNLSSANTAIINYKNSTNKSNIEPGPMKMVIVSDPMFKETLKPFIEWKRKTGYNIIEAYTDNPDVGKNESSIKNYLKSLYLKGTASDPPQSYVLLVGDVAQIPAFKGTASDYYYFTDLFYVEYTDDYLPEAICGRFSANNIAELIPQIKKTLQYEKYTMPDPSYLDNAMLIAGYDKNYAEIYANGQMNYAASNYINSTNGINAFLTKFPNSSKEVSNIKQRINNGAAIINYSAHGSWDGWVNPGLHSFDVPNFQNKDKYGLMIGNACYTQSFDKYSCFGETLLRAEDKGAIGYIGASCESYWDEDYWWSTGFGVIDSMPTYGGNKLLGAYDRLFHTHGEDYKEWATTQGEILQSGNLAVTQSGSPEYAYYWEIYNLMGDPTLMPYLSKPKDLKIKLEDTLLIKSSYVKIYTEPYTYVALSLNDTLLGVSLSDTNGIANINITPFNKSTSIEIYATHQNRIPFAGQIHFIEKDISHSVDKPDTTNIPDPDLTNNYAHITSNDSRIHNFEGRAENNRIILSWNTEKEEDIDYFAIEKSNNGIIFNEIAKVNAEDNNNQNIDYSYSDDNPNKEINYYKLKQVYRNGNFKYFSDAPTKVKSEDKHEMTIWPNPSDGQNINIFIKKK